MAKPSTLAKAFPNGYDYYDDHVVDVHVGNLRRKLSEAAGEQLLATIRGVGFSLRRNGEVADIRS